MTMKAVPLLIAGALVAATLASCSLPGTGESSDELVDDLSLSQSTYQVVDLVTGTVVGSSTLPDLTTNPDYRSTKMVFHLVPGGSSLHGAPSGALGDGVDDAGAASSLGYFYIGVFEVTQGQWQQLTSGATPWTTASVEPAGTAGSLATDTDQPAYGLSRTMVDATLSDHNATRTYRLGLPTDGQWEHACRGGTTTPFYWGANANDRTTAQLYALVAETRGATPGPSAVAQRQANPFGLYDIQGNVWELTHTGNTTALRGGSWFDQLSLARSSHVLSIDRGTAHVLAGARLVLVP